MQYTLRYLLLTGATLLTATGAEAQIQQSGYKNAASGCCKEGCVTISEKGSCRKDDYCNNGQCPGDRCTLRSRHEDLCLDWCGRCGPVGRAARKGCPAAQKLCWCCKTKAYPDSGWAPPARLPVNRTGGWYQSYWPNQWYGNPGGGFEGGAPIVYQPTDTTQLGYSYNRVPTWRPNPGMIPRVPSPSNYHARMCPSRRGCQTGTPIIYNGGNNCPSCNPGYVNTATQRRTPQIAQATQLAQPRQPQTPPSDFAAAPAIVPAQSINVPDSYTPQDVPMEEQPGAPSAGNSVRPVSNTVTRQPTSAGPSRPGKRVNRGAGTTRRQTKKPSGGWFGLPSLNEVRF